MRAELSQPAQCEGLWELAPYTSPWFWWWVGNRESWCELRVLSQPLSPWAQCPPKFLLNCVPFFGSWDDIHWQSPSPLSLSLPRGTQGSHIRREMMMSRGKLMNELSALSDFVIFIRKRFSYFNQLSHCSRWVRG